MIKIINKREYNTETASMIKKVTYGHFGDPCGYEEILFQTPDGLYFVYGCGGGSSPYPAESITRLAKNKVDVWVENH